MTSTTAITVFTPTYNRAHTLPALYNSLREQSFRDFEWLVVDDGSSDGTPELLDAMAAAGGVAMRTERTPNGGKHRAINLGVKEARGELFFIVDSDDRLPPDSLDTVTRYWDEVRGDPTFAGVCGGRLYPSGEKIGTPFTYDVLDCSTIELRHRHGMRGDMAEVFCTRVLGEYAFPEYAGERFVSEAVVWNRIAARYRLRCFSRGIYVCDYLPDGLSQSVARLHRASPCGTMEYYADCSRLKGAGSLSKAKAAVQYWRFTAGYGGHREHRLPAWGYALWPAGVFFRLLDGWREHRADLEPLP